MKWNYMIVELKVQELFSEEWSEMNQQLSELGDGEWEAVSVWPKDSKAVRILCKRPKKSE